jgi:hypothetical protein
MNKTKPLLILLIALCVACSKSQDQACVAPAVEKNIIGTWTIKVPTGSDKVTFNADGTLVDDAGIMVDGEINGVKTTKRTWSIANNKLSVNASAPGNGSIGFILNILDNQCSKITLDYVIAKVDMTR